MNDESSPWKRDTTHLLTPTHLDSLLATLGIIAFLRFHNEFVNVGEFRRFDHVRFRSPLLAAIENVVSNGAIVEYRFLCHQSYLLMKVLVVIVFDGNPIESDGTALGFVKVFQK